MSEHPLTEDLQAALNSDEAYALLPEGDWMAGGCGLLADALNRLIPGSRVALVGRLAEGIRDHAVVGLPDPVEGGMVFVDYEGPQTALDVIHNVAAEAGVGSERINIDVPDGDPLGTFDFRENAPALAKYLQQTLGEIPADRVSMSWLDDNPSPSPALA